MSSFVDEVLGVANAVTDATRLARSLPAVDADPAALLALFAKLGVDQKDNRPLVEAVSLWRDRVVSEVNALAPFLGQALEAADRALAKSNHPDVVAVPQTPCKTFTPPRGEGKLAVIAWDDLPAGHTIRELLPKSEAFHYSSELPAAVVLGPTAVNILADAVTPRRWYLASEVVRLTKQAEDHRRHEHEEAERGRYKEPPSPTVSQRLAALEEKARIGV